MILDNEVDYTKIKDLNRALQTSGDWIIESVEEYKANLSLIENKICSVTSPDMLNFLNEAKNLTLNLINNEIGRSNLRDEEYI